MKKNLLAFFLSFSYSLLSAQPTWTWLQGDRYSPAFGVYGLKGIANALNRPGNRTDETSWKDSAGNIWVFGGIGQSAGGTGVLNDLWKYERSSGLWTWIAGDKFENLLGVYGQKGLASAANRIRARSNAVCWVDASGNFWIFGGKGVDASVQSSVPFYLNDLWKFSPSTGLWTWMRGDTLYKTVLSYAGVYGHKGISAANNYPCSRFNATNWTDLNGDMWLFGGDGTDFSTRIGLLNDLWKFSASTQQWTWIAGDTILNQSAIFGSKGIAAASNKPGSRSNAVAWVDGSGRSFLFGGQIARAGPDPAVFTNDLWMFIPSTGFWTWIGGTIGGSSANYGTRGVPSILNIPGSRFGSRGDIDTSGNLLLYGGTAGLQTTFNDLWKYNPSTQEWTWLNGSMGLGTWPAVYGAKGMSSDSSRPAGGSFKMVWIDNSNNVWVGSTNHLFRYAPSTDQWTWIKGDTASSTQHLYASYGAKGVPASNNTPGPRQYGASWSDWQGNFWLFGGYDFYQQQYVATGSPKNDIWKYSPLTNQWVWLNGDSVSNPGYSYGQKGVTAPGNLPPGRQSAMTWEDLNGNFWMFGGINGSSIMSDLWMYASTTGMWTWMAGSSSGNSSSGVYGTLGVAAPANSPGDRYSGTGWIDKNNNLWLYGGTASIGKYNDLWKYTVSTGLWTWISGDRFSIQLAPYYSPNYGQLGIPGSQVQPGGRSNAISWTDTTGNFWMFGGMAYLSGKSMCYNDLWKYSPSVGWVWMSGDNTPNQQGNYIARGVASALNKPAARNAAVAWIDGNSNLYFFGGNVDTITTAYYPLTIRYYNDVWKYSIASNMWTWLSGDSVANTSGYYGTLGTASSINYPGARTGSMGWKDGSGKLWMYGGYGYPESGMRYLNDMLIFAPQSALPVLFNNFTAQQQNKSALLLWSTAQEFNSRFFTVERSPNGTDYSNIGSLPAAGNATMVSNYYFTDKSPLNGNNFYRIKETDADGSATYSVVKQLTFGEQTARFSIINNPVIHDIQLNVELPFTQDISVQLTDANGRLLSIQKYVGSKGSTIISVPATSLSHGTYMISVTGESLKETKVLLK